MIRTTAAIAALALAPAMAHAGVPPTTAFTGWEDIGADAVFGTFGNVGDYGYTSTPDPVYDGSHSLFLTESPSGGTPNAVVAWISGLSDGDEITATMWFKGLDTDGSASTSKGRIWGAYYGSADSTTYEGSAGGPSGYAGDSGDWESITHTWTYSGGGDVFGLQARIYAYGGNDRIWADNLSISVLTLDNIQIDLAGVASTPVVPGPVAGLAMVAGLAGVRRRRR